jgi:hypothetical protein
MSSKYADEGTIAHALAAMALAEGKPASAYIGRVIESEDYEHASLSPSGAARWMRCPGSHALETRIAFKPRKFSAPVTDEMAEYVQIYLDNLEKYRVGLGHGNADVMIEQKLPVGHITGEPGATGSGDYIILDYGAGEIQVHDLKFGRGVEVDAEDNEQLQLYLLGALEQYEILAPEGGWKTFRGVIHQPRINFVPSEDVWTLEELVEFGLKAMNGAKTARIAKEFADNWVGKEGQDQYLVPGDKQCKFCDAKADCPVLTKLVGDTVLGGFENLDDPRQPTPATAPIPKEDTTRLALYLSRVELIEGWCSAIAAAAEGKLLAGEQIPGYKVVQGKRGNRAWGNDAEAEALLKSFRLKQEQMYSFKLISPTQAEKVLKETPKRWGKAQTLITQSDGKPTVVPADDKRPALVITPVADQFVNLEAQQELV